MRILKPFLIGFICIVLSLIMGVPKGYAIYSPAISNQIAIMRGHMFDARQLNGTGSLRHGVTKLFDDQTVRTLAEEDRARRQAGQATGLPAEFKANRSRIKVNTNTDAITSFGGNFLLIFNRLLNPKRHEDGADFTIPITSCLRDDIFELQELRDAVSRESLRSSILQNKTHAALLINDYGDIVSMIRLLKTRYTETSLFFPGMQENYYVDCTQGGFFGDFVYAFQDLKRSWDTLKTVLTLDTLGQSAGNGQWGNIWQMARARARVRASQWIAANQITLTIGGEEGGNPTSWVKREGMGGIAAAFKTEWGIAKALVAPIVPLFDGTLIDIATGNICVYHDPPPKNQWRACTEQEQRDFEQKKCTRCRNRLRGRSAEAVAHDLQAQLKERQVKLAQAETSIRFNLEFSSVEEESLLDLEKNLYLINTQIKRATEAFGERAGRALPTICQEFQTILRKQCPNKGGDLPACR